MEALKYTLANGLEFGTEPELDAYIRGLELVRQEGDLSAAQHKKFAEWLDDAHTTKSRVHAAAKAQEQAAKEALAKDGTDLTKAA